NAVLVAVSCPKFLKSTVTIPTPTCSTSPGGMSSHDNRHERDERLQGTATVGGQHVLALHRPEGRSAVSVRNRAREQAMQRIPTAEGVASPLSRLARGNEYSGEGEHRL